LVRQIEATPPLMGLKEIKVINQQSLPFWSELRHVEVNGKDEHIIVGPIAEVINYCDSDDEGPLSPEQRIGWPEKAETASRHGFLVLALANSSSPDAMLRRKFRLAGLVILEPKLDERAMIDLRQIASQGQVRFASLASEKLAAALFEKVFEVANPKAVRGEDIVDVHPKEQERIVDQAVILGSIGDKQRYWIARQLQRHHYLVVVSRLSRDSELPADQHL